MKRIETDVVVIGGGATGAGVLRDCAMRGLKGILIEKDDLAAGATGRNHGLLHSGARYAVKDQHSAVECIAENKILRTVAAHCVEDTGGLFVTLPGADTSYQSKLIEGCTQAGIETREISVEEALKIEPNLNPKIEGAVTTPDASVDPFRLTSSNILDATERGSKFMNHTEVINLIRQNDKIVGVHCYDKLTKKFFEVYAKIVVNAAAIWGQHLCQTAGIEFKMFPSKGTLIIFDYRVNNTVLNMCRPPGDGDILVPGDTVTVIGTTSTKIPYDTIDDNICTDDEVELMINNAELLCPNISKTRILRAYSGVRPLVPEPGDSDGRNISRGIVLVDHKERDGADNFISITGGKLMTYRLMAEEATDLVCKKLGVNEKCTTHQIPLPGSESRIAQQEKATFYPSVSESVVGATYFRHGERFDRVLKKDDKANNAMVCECEMVSHGEVKYALEELGVKDMVDLRRRTRVGMGPCQGELCGYRAAGAMEEYSDQTVEESTENLIGFLDERWKGVKPVLWSEALRESELTYWLYAGMYRLGDLQYQAEEGE